MIVVDDVRQVLHHFLAPELREIRSRLDALDKRLDSTGHTADIQYQGMAQRWMRSKTSTGTTSGDHSAP